LCFAIHGTACKPRETLAPIDMSVAPPDGRIAADAERMTWRGITPSSFSHDSGAIVVTLHEPEARIGHVRFILPTRTPAGLGGDSSLDAAPTWVVATALEDEWRRKLVDWDSDATSPSGRTKPRGTVAAIHRPDRVELVVEVANVDVPRVLAIWGDIVAMRRPQTLLSRAQGRAVATSTRPSLELLAVSHAVVMLWGDPIETAIATREDLEALTPAALEKVWTALLDPRHAVVVVHTAHEATVIEDASASWSAQWKSRGLGIGRRSEAQKSALRRVLPERSDTARPEHLMAVPPLTLRAVEIRDAERRESPQVVVARVVPTPTARDRALLRLGQRILQEEMDLRVVFAGARAIVVARLPLSSTQPGRSLVEGAARWRNVLEGPMTVERLDTAARLWIGARWVHASLHGEDATATWSEAMDLATSDEGIASALDEDTAAMLAIDVDEWTTFARRWLDPSKGEPGWVGVVAGANEAQLAALSEVTPVKR
jgi:hypothetical protein